MEKMLVVVLDIIQVMLHDGGNKRCALKKRKCCHYCGISRWVYKLKDIWAFKFSVGFVARRTFLNHALTMIMNVHLLSSFFIAVLTCFTEHRLLCLLVTAVY